jgi:hypothetical protein
MGNNIEETGTRYLFRMKLKIENKVRVAELLNWQPTLATILRRAPRYS